MRTDRYLKTELAENKKQGYGMFWQLVIYTLLFVAAALGAYSFYIMGKSVFVTANSDGNKDGLTQIIPSYIAVKHIVEGVIAGKGFGAWNWSIGLGGDNWNMFASKLANPFTYMIIAFPEEKIDIGYSIVSIFRQYCVGLAFLCFGKKVKLTANQNVLGALCYAFSMWMFMTLPDQAGFNTAALLFPLLMLGAEKIIDNESPIIFIVSVFYFLTAGVVWGYASGIMIVFYFILRMIMNGSLKHPKEFFGTTGRFILCGVAGILIASFFVAEILMSMSAATTDTGSGKQTWFSVASYLAVPKSLYIPVKTGANSYSAIGLPIVGVALMPMIIRKIFRGKTEAVMALLLLIGSQIPAVCRMFNGFSYPSGRWFYMVAFFVTWAAIENFSVDTLKSRVNCIIMELWLILTAGWVVYRYMYMGLDNRKTALAAIAGFIFGTAIIILGHVRASLMSREDGEKSYALACRMAIIFIMLITVMDIMEIGVFDSFTHAGNGVPGYAHAGDGIHAVVGTSESVMKTVQEKDDSFYRYDKKGGYFGIRTVGAVINSSIALGTRPVYTCFSSAPSSWHDFNKAVGNSAGNYRRTLVDGNNGRAMLDYLMGVKYFIGSPTDTSIEKNKKASLYVPYGYGKKEDVEGYELFTNKYCMGLGTSYSQYITRSEFDGIPVHLREQALMQTAVVPDSYDGKLEGVKHASASDIKLNIEEPEIEIEPTRGIEIDNHNRIMKIRSTVDCIYIKTDGIENRQLIFALENFKREKISDKELAELTEGYEEGTVKNKTGFKIKTAHREVFRDGTETVWNGTKSEAGGVRSFNDIDSFYINLGYFENAPEYFEIYINNPGIYSFDAIKLYAVPMDSYDENASLLDSRKFEISEWGDDYAKGTMSCDQNSIMYFSILRNKGWHIYIDGEEVQKIKDVNISFTGAMIPAGEHQVELKYIYPYFYLLYASTVAGLLMTVAILIVYHRKKGNRANE